MPTLKERVLELVNNELGLTDRQIADRLCGEHRPQQPVNQATRALAASGEIVRRTVDGLVRNYPSGHHPQPVPHPDENPTEDALSEDAIKRSLKNWLEGNGWKVQVAWGNAPGIDVDAHKMKQRWVIEAKGKGSRPQMRVNYFLAILGTVLQRMGDSNVKYSIALPDLQQYRKLWNRLPSLAKERTKISALFVDEHGDVDEVG